MVDQKDNLLTKQYIVNPIQECHEEIGRALWMLEDARQRTRNEMTHIDATMIDKVGGSNDHSIGSLLYHIAAIEISWLAEEVAVENQMPKDVWDHFPFDVRNDEGKLTSVKGVNMEEHWQRLDYTRQLLLRVYKPMSLEEFRRPRHFEAYDVTPEWVLHHLMQHEAGHREEMCILRDMWKQEA